MTNPTPLSPAAQAVLFAVEDDCIHPDDKHRIAAAVLRAAAEELQYMLFLPGNDLYVVEARALFKLANELEGAQ